MLMMKLPVLQACRNLAISFMSSRKNIIDILCVYRAGVGSEFLRRRAPYSQEEPLRLIALIPHSWVNFSATIYKRDSHFCLQLKKAERTECHNHQWLRPTAVFCAHFCV
jgi:hypothetical protein